MLQNSHNQTTPAMAHRTTPPPLAWHRERRRRKMPSASEQYRCDGSTGFKNGARIARDRSGLQAPKRDKFGAS